MRSIQRGIATLIILAILLVTGVAIASAYFIFYQNQQKLKPINSITDFESCVKAGNPVTASYPGTCRTSDGKSFVQPLSDEEKKKLDDQFKVLSSPFPSPSDETANPDPGSAGVAWKSYTDSTYDYTIQYPSGWTLKQEKDHEGSPSIRLTSANATKTTFSGRLLPEVYITVVSPYSTSGTVCANQWCTSTDPLKVIIKNQEVAIPVIKGEIGGDRRFDFYAFIFALPGKKITLEGYSEPVELNAIASYGTMEEGSIISSILSTLTY